MTPKRARFLRWAIRIAVLLFFLAGVRVFCRTVRELSDPPPRTYRG